MESEIEQSILKTVLYSDIFDYPLTPEQIWKYLITGRSIKRKDFGRVLKNIKEPIEEKDGWYFTSGREDLIKKRLKRRKESDRKLSIVQETAKRFFLVPTILMVGVSGGVSMRNADKNDDIDIFVVAKKNSIWLTRLFIILLLKFMGKHRARLDKKVADKICLNMLIDEKNLELPKDRQDLYTAHEVSQMKPVFNKNRTYEKFISKNKWVLDFMPNAVRIKNEKQQFAVNYLLFPVEFLVKEIQLWYIKRHLSRETVNSELLAFHSRDYKGKILNVYEERLKNYAQKI